MKKILVRYLLIIYLSLFYSGCYAQVINSRSGVDTLSLTDRLSLHVNAVDWLLLTPQVSVEYDLGNKNWNRWSVIVSVKNNWQSKHTYQPGLVYNIKGFRGEVRNYWRTKEITDSSQLHKSLIDKIFSFRRTSKYYKHPATTYYRGLYLSSDNYSIKFGKKGKQGKSFGVGISYGCIRPLYIYPGGSSIDLDLGISVGFMYSMYDDYVYNREDNCFIVTGHHDWHIVNHPVLSQIKLGFIYRFGNYPSTGEKTTKYRWRYDVDKDYQTYIDSITTLKDSRRIERESEMKKDISRKSFVADSIAKAKKNELHEDSINKIIKKQQKLKKKEEERLHKDSIRIIKRSEQKAKKLYKIRQGNLNSQDSLQASVVADTRLNAMLQRGVKDFMSHWIYIQKDYSKKECGYSVCWMDERRKKMYGV